jgi:hypothetical protein
MNLYNMFNSISKEHKVHSFRSVHGVEFLELGLAVLLDEITFSQLTIKVRNGLLRPVIIRVYCRREGSK